MWFRNFTAAVLFAAAPAGADGLRLTRPRAASGPSAPRVGDATVPQCVLPPGWVSIPCQVDLQYFGGPVLANVKVYAVFWDSTVNPDVTLGMAGFYQTLTNSEWMDWLSEYSTTLTVQAGRRAGQPGTQQVIGRGTFAGSYTLPVLSTVYPTCTGGLFHPETLTCLQDTDVQQELLWQIKNGHIPNPDSNTLYVVHLPASVKVTVFQLTPPTDYTSCQQFCAYHSSFVARPKYGGGNQVWPVVFYAVVPDLGSNGCQDGCGTGTTFDNTCVAASHEVAEAITDGFSNQDSATDYPLGWYDTETNSQGEIGDMCTWQTDTLDVNGIPGCSGPDAGCYAVQQLFSNILWNADAGAQPNVAACVSSRFDVDDYAISLSPNTLTLVRGIMTAVVPVLTTLTNGSPQPLALSVPQLPPGMHASFDNPFPKVGEAANLTVSSDADAPLFQDGQLVVLATGAATHSASLLMQLHPQNAWSLSLSPATARLLPGSSQTFTLSGTVTDGTVEPVSLSGAVGGLPPGVSASLSSLTLTPGATTSVLMLSVSAEAPGAPPSPVAVTGVSASQPGGHAATVSLQVDTPPRVSITTPTAGTTVSEYTLLSVVVTAGAMRRFAPSNSPSTRACTSPLAQRPLSCGTPTPFRMAATPCT